ncbi:MAG TPA: hypothetical protein VG992_02890 [Candidatus Saccharimonadales bacterium]|nr:hypothetical protein [Candidatus Saccharimonadales bacterium]
MPPNNAPIPKTPTPVSEDQGALLDVSFEGNNSFDPDSYKATARFTEVPDGVFNEPATADPEPTAEEREAARQAEISQRRHAAQVGKHSVLGATGKYESITPGDYLPGFGPVTYTNLGRAEEHAAHLEAERTANQRPQTRVAPTPANEAEPVLAAEFSEEPEPVAPTKLTKQEKLNIFEQDERLQFYPATDREEEQARRALNYIEEEHGVLNMLDEIARHNYKYARQDGLSDSKARHAGNIARQSVVREMGDHLGNALDQLAQLRALEQATAGLNPKLSLAEAVGDDHPALAALVRDCDYETFRRDGKDKLGFNPLSTKEDRGQQADPDKNKTVEDIYTGSQQSEDAHEAIQRYAATTIGELYRSRELQATIARQTVRANFWDNILAHTEGADKRVANDIRERYGLHAA